MADIKDTEKPNVKMLIYMPELPVVGCETVLSCVAPLPVC
jgi:hypothetical protein